MNEPLRALLLTLPTALGYLATLRVEAPGDSRDPVPGLDAPPRRKGRVRRRVERTRGFPGC